MTKFIRSVFSVMLYIVIVLLAVCSGFSQRATAALAADSAESAQYDYNGDGTVSVADAVMLMAYIAEAQDSTLSIPESGETVTLTELAGLLRFLSSQTPENNVPPAQNAPPPLRPDEVESLPLDTVSKLMIVAHPDDETLWGGAHLLQGGYLVVCITNGDDPVRAGEFRTAVRGTGNIPLILSYPDKTGGEKDTWDTVRDSICADLRLILTEKHWDFVVTHNPRGEYGHIHHKMTNRIVTQLFEETQSADQLWYFGTYYTWKRMAAASDTLTPISEDELDEKMILCRIYASQKKAIQKRTHMLPYELWTEYQAK